MGAACTVCKSGDESYNLSHNRIDQEPRIVEQNYETTAVYNHSRHRPHESNSDIQDENEFSSSNDVHLQVDDETKPQVPEEEKTETNELTKETQSSVSSLKLSRQPNVESRSSSDTSKQAVKVGHKTSPSDLSTLTRITEDEANDIISKCWKDIEDTCGNAKRVQDKTIIVPGCRVVRLFVSSTFTDYHAERELLVKKVFPELREWCEEHHIQLIECDLRWGVPKDTTTEMTIKTCLEEIDRCKEECNDTPFFLNMLGERYGWMPSESDIPQDIQAQYKWIFPLSITHMEILHAAYRTNNPNAAFFVRDPGFITDIPPEMKPAFVDEFVLNKASLKILKNKLKERLPDQVFEYRCEYDGIDQSTGKEKVKLKGLDGFRQSVLNHFKSCIEKTFPASQKELSPDEQELIAQDNFIRSRGSLLLGRQNEVSSIIEYVKYGRLPGQANAGDGSYCPMLLVQGVPGSGKSSLMAYCTLEVKKMDLLLFYHFVGSAPGSTDALKLSNRLYKWLNNITNTAKEEKEDEEIPLNEVQKKMQKILKDMEKLDKTVVIVIDALNQLSDAESVEHLDWMPMEIPSNTRFIVSAVKDSRSSHVLVNEEKRLAAPLCLLVGELDNSVKKEIVDYILGVYNKKLDHHQMTLLISIEGAANPLWLSLSCEELRVFGVFERVTEHIQSLPSFLEGLLQFILKRLVTEDEFNNVEKVLCALYCMSLTETELRYLLKDEDATEPLPMLKWAMVRRTLKPFLRNTGQRGEEERLDFFHASISDLVKESLIADVNEKTKWHLKIANYFQYVCKDESRATEAVAVQLKYAADKKRLLEFLRDDIRGQRKSPIWKSQYYKFILCGRMIPQVAYFREEVSLCKMCSMQHKGFGQIARLNKDSCCVCGNFVSSFWKKPDHVAMLCQEHKPRHAPGQTMCYLCNKPAFMGADTAYTCMICSPGFQKCVKFTV